MFDGVEVYGEALALCGAILVVVIAAGTADVVAADMNVMQGRRARFFVSTRRVCPVESGNSNRAADSAGREAVSGARRGRT